MKNVKLTGTITCFLVGICLFAQAPNVNDILSPASDKNAPTQVASPEAVKEKKVNNSKDGATVRVEAASMQDAANHSRKLKNKVVELKVGSGIAYIASGTASYGKYQNRTTSLLSQRKALCDALMAAKGNLSKYLEGMTINGREELKNSLTAVSSEKEEASMYSSLGVESIEQHVEAMLRGYAMYEVNDEPSANGGGKVTVRIVSSPRTRSAGIALSGGMIVSGDFNSSFKKLYAELSTGCLPPEGAKVFYIYDDKNNQHPYFVSFGSSIIRDAKNERMKDRLAEGAERTASLRAAANMNKLLTGDKIVWTSGHIELTKEEQQDGAVRSMVNGMGKDVLATFGIGKEVGEQAENKYRNIMKSTDYYSSATQGKLPRGIKEYTWNDENGDWAYCLLVFNPNMTQAVDSTSIQRPKSAAAAKKGKKTEATKPARNDNIKQIPAMTTKSDDI